LTTGQLAVYSSLAAAVIPLLENENKDLIHNLVRVDSHKHTFGNRKISGTNAVRRKESKMILEEIRMKLQKIT
jgi:translation initiation factor 6 (eIF-6)